MIERSTTPSRRGSALVLSLIAIVTLAAMGAAFLRITTSLTSRQTDDVENMKAFYLAEAGLAEGFQAVRMGRTGQVGSEAAPAAYGDGMVWVDATTTLDDQVRLESTALVGRGRASLAYVVEPVKVPLGFFGDQELVVESVLLVDGYDSAAGSYPSQVVGDALVLNQADPFLHIDPAGGIVFNNQRFYRYHTSEGDTYYYDHVVGLAEIAASDFGTEYDIQPDDFIDHTPPAVSGDFGDSEYEGVKAYFAAVPPPADLVAGRATSVQGPTTGDGGLVGSNGDIVFLAPPEDDVEVFGDAVPGPDGTIRGLGSVEVTGDTNPRIATVELPEVRVPEITLDAPVRHADLLPLLVPAGAVGYERIEVAGDAELVLQGPSTVVIGTLVLEPGATLSLDTRDGDVALYVTAEMDLQPGSLVSTSDDPREATVLVPEIPNGLDGAPIRLDARAQFHGTIYAPRTDVAVGGEFEVFGGVIAKRLEIGAGARLHFDHAGFEDSPIPRIVSWKIVEVPSAARGVRDPFERLGLTADELAPLAESHDLASVNMVVTYLDHMGALRTYDGTEDLFDWDLVREAIEVDRDPERKADLGSDAPPDRTKEPRTQAELDLIAAIHDGTLSSGEISKKIQLMAPVSDAVLVEVMNVDPPMTSEDLYLALESCGPVDPGFPGAKGDGPLSDRTLLSAIHDSPLTSKDLTWILEQNSPLSAEVLGAIYDRTPPMAKGDIHYVERVQ